jgi:prepilin-type N-terminal cleavage/methylation domain-containing protein
MSPDRLRTLFDTRRGHHRGAFTVIELIVVIAIITIIVLIALPRFTAMIAAQEEQLAINLVRVAMKTGRDAAMRSGGDEDGAVVFFYRPAESSSPQGGRLVMIPCVKVGSFLDDPRRMSGTSTTEVEGKLRDIFVPLSGADPVMLPRNWMIRGYTPPNTVEPGGEWYETGNGNPRYLAEEGNWVFPETDFYKGDEGWAGENRQTFMVRFKAGTGELVTVPNTTAIVVDVRPNYEDRDADSTLALYQAYDREAFVRKMLRQGGIARQRLFGHDSSGAISSDMVLVRPVAQLALYDETRLAASLAVRISPGSGTIYRRPPDLDSSGVQSPGNDASSDFPQYLDNIDPNRVNQWIEGDTNFSTRVEGADGTDEPQAYVYSIDRYTGVPRRLEVQP